jgi:hypothetical protein
MDKVFIAIECAHLKRLIDPDFAYTYDDFQLRRPYAT